MHSHKFATTEILHQQVEDHRGNPTYLCAKTNVTFSCYYACHKQTVCNTLHSHTCKTAGEHAACTAHPTCDASELVTWQTTCSALPQAAYSNQVTAGPMLSSPAKQQSLPGSCRTRPMAQRKTSAMSQWCCQLWASTPADQTGAAFLP